MTTLKTPINLNAHYFLDVNGETFSNGVLICSDLKEFEGQIMRIKNIEIVGNDLLLYVNDGLFINSKNVKLFSFKTYATILLNAYKMLKMDKISINYNLHSHSSCIELENALKTFKEVLSVDYDKNFDFTITLK